MLLRTVYVARLVPSGLSEFDRKRNNCRQTQFKTVAEGRKPDQNPRANNRSRKGASIENKKRRRGRPAWTRKPDDTPFRDGNRDRLVGLLTERAARTLCYYLSETNLNVHHWLMSYMQKNPIPRSGAWDDVSGETFLRNLLSMPLEHAKWTTGRDPLYDNIPGCGVDPRNLAQRVMAIRSQLSLEFIEDLKDVSEENSTLLRESLVSSLSMSFDDMPVAEKPVVEKGTSVSADKSQGSASTDKKNAPVSGPKKDISVPADKKDMKDSSVSVNKKDTSVSADKKDSDASAIASLKLSLESLPVAEKPVLRKDSSVSTGKTNSLPVTEKTKPADKKDGSVSGDKKDSPVSVAKQDSSAFADRKDSPVSADIKDSPVSAAKQDGAAFADMKDSPVSADIKDSPVSAAKQDGSAFADRKDSPVSGDKEDGPISADKNDISVPVDKDSPVSAPNKDSPVSDVKKGISSA